ncbi:unnamed protein product [Leptosia nina]|uniref:Multiple inositol polyphosphate phosphatase 1 n=1 Tax=Leptosia nina TaxID=320188 RepID=A0AAV1JYA1_9NEOP
MYHVLNLLLVLSLGVVLSERSCYWNSQCPFGLFATRTPYDAVRGDIRDWPLLEGCEAVSLWALIRHGNRNPGKGGTIDMRDLQRKIKDEIVEKFDYEMGTSQLCSQDIANFRNWKWNSTMETSPSYLTGTGYEEIYNMAVRIKEKYPQLLLGSGDSFYFRSTVKQRTVTSSMAFVHGLSEGTNLNLTLDKPRESDDVLRPYDNCDRYQTEVKNGPLLEEQLEAFYKTPEFLEVQEDVQRRLGIPTQLSADDIYNLYELCRFDRTWSPDLRSPWCAAFSPEDLLVLEYRDDVRHYYKNAYGSRLNVKLGYPAMKNLYESLLAAKRGDGKNIVAYFAHDTLMGMVYSALGLYRDAESITAQYRNPTRQWRTTYLAPFCTNLMVFLNRCQDSGQVSYKVQIFNNEKPTTLCPIGGCTWDQFVSIFQPFTNSSLDFCKVPGEAQHQYLPGGAAESKLLPGLLILSFCLLMQRE